MTTQPAMYTSRVEFDPESGEYLIAIPQAILESEGWGPDTPLLWRITDKSVFIERDVRPSEDEIDDRICAWHSGKTRPGLPIWECLGWSQEEYEAWVQDNEAVPNRPLPSL